MASSSNRDVDEANINPTILIIRDRLRSIFPDVKISPEIIGWHLRKSNSVEQICEHLINEILQNGKLENPMDMDEDLKMLFSIFCEIPVDEVIKIYRQDKAKNDPDWYDNVLKKLLDLNSKTDNKRKSNEAERFSDEKFYRLLAIFPDIDPEFARKTIDQDPNKNFEDIVTHFIEKGYRKLAEHIRRNYHEHLKENLMHPKFEIDEFLRTFPDPVTYFHDRSKIVSETYKRHAFVYLANAFARLSTEYIEQTLKLNNYRFAPALDQLKQEFANYHNSHRRKGTKIDAVSKFLIRTARAPIRIPEIPDEVFYKELCFTKHEDEIIEYLSTKRSIREEQIRLAKLNETLQTCDCCANDQLLPIDFISCDQNHEFCQDCVKNYIETSFNNDGRVFFHCLFPDCKYEYPTQLIGQILSPTLFSRLLIRIQQEEIRLANIPNFEQCKFCTFGTIMDDPDERIFRCLNPECLKETCRNCGELNHIPLRCDEVEKRDELDMRTFIENHVSESMIRICYKCKRRFYKTEGCNKMTCACGASMCYVCRAPINGYDHFNNNKTCEATRDVVELHQQEMKQAYEAAKKAYVERHPDARDIVLKYDPQQHLAETKQKTKSHKRFRN